MRSFSLSFSVSSSLSSPWRGSSSSKKKTFKKKKTNRCRQTSRNFTSVFASSLKNDENDDDDQTTTPGGVIVVKEEAREKTIYLSSKVDFAMPNRLLSSENLTTVRRFLSTKASRLSNFKFFFFRKGVPFIFHSKLTSSSITTLRNTLRNRMKLKTLDFERTRYTFARDSRTRRKKAVLTGNNRPR